MKRRMMIFLMVCLFVLGALPVYAAGASLDFLVSADKKAASVGDTVHYTIIAKGEDVIALQFDVAVPDGMRYIPDSAATPKGLSNALGVAAAGWTEQTMRFSFYNDKAVQIPEGTVLLTFDCTVTAEGSHQVSLSGVAPYDSDFTGFEPAIQTDTVLVGEVSGEGETELQPVPPETDIEEPDPGTETPPDEVTVPTATEQPGTSSGSEDGSDTPPEGTTGVGSGGDPDTGDVPAGSVGGSVEGSTGSAGDNVSPPDTGTTDAPSGNGGASLGGSTDAPSGDGNTSSQDSSTSSGNGSTTHPNNETQAPDTPVSNPEGGIPEQETVNTDETPVQQPGQDTVISGENTLPGAAEGDTADQKQEEGTASGEGNASASDPGETENNVDTVPSEQHNAADKNEDQQPVWLWLTLAVVGVLAIAAVIFLIMKKKQQ